MTASEVTVLSEPEVTAVDMVEVVTSIAATAEAMDSTLSAIKSCLICSCVTPKALLTTSALLDITPWSIVPWLLCLTTSVKTVVIGEMLVSIL